MRVKRRLFSEESRGPTTEKAGTQRQIEACTVSDKHEGGCDSPGRAKQVVELEE